MLVQDEVESFDDFLDDPDENVNLYELLDVAPDADLKQIRKRIGEMFLEAQNNVDHRSFRRRFYYRELMETVLPRARHHLLNPEHRDDYDRSLGLLPPLPPPPQFIPPPPLTTQPDAPVSSTEVVTNASLDASATSLSDEEEEIDFSKFVPVASSSTGNAAHATLDATVWPQSQAQETPPVVMEQRGGAPEHLRMDAERVERRRDSKRRELIKQELMDAGTRWAALAGGGALIATGSMLFGLGLALSSDLLKTAALPVALIAAALCARYAHREARKHMITLLSQMPYEQLLRRCARM